MVFRSPEQLGNRGMQEGRAARYLQKFESGPDESNLRWLFDEHLKRLRECWASLPVGHDGRLSADQFFGRLPADEIVSDQRRVEEVEETIRRDPEKQGSGVADLLEILKVVYFGQWFGDMITVRTARYDDIFSHADELVVDTKTHEALAAIDVTTDVRDKWDDSNVQDMMLGGVRVKYGFSLTEAKDTRLESIQRLPLFIISVRSKSVLEWARVVEEKMPAAEREAYLAMTRASVVNSLIDQAERGAEGRFTNGRIAEKYRIFAKRFSEYNTKPRESVV